MGRSKPNCEKAVEDLDVPCGTCIGCRENKAKHYALRCYLELEDHRSALCMTLTYKPEKRPVTLSKRHLQLFMKRLRTAHAKKQRKAGIRPKAIKPLRFFASGEYGEKTNLPHYHAIVYSLSEADAQTVREAWALGHVDIKPATKAGIAYIAGYAAKKYGDSTVHTKGERIDYETGEVYTYQPPFLQMSNRPGIGAKARAKHRNSWAKTARLNDQTISVPRYLNDYWKKTATKHEIEKNEQEKYELRSTIRKTPEQLDAEYLIQQAKTRLKRDRRTGI